jgi:hypothetical protein
MPVASAVAPPFDRGAAAVAQFPVSRLLRSSCRIAAVTDRTSHRSTQAASVPHVRTRAHHQKTKTSLQHTYRRDRYVPPSFRAHTPPSSAAVVCRALKLKIFYRPSLPDEK